MSHTDRTVLERQKEFGDDVFLARHLLLNPTIGRLADAIDRSSFASLRAQEETEGSTSVQLKRIGFSVKGVPANGRTF
jgi:hypothetical protein